MLSAAAHSTSTPTPVRPATRSAGIVLLFMRRLSVVPLRLAEGGGQVLATVEDLAGGVGRDLAELLLGGVAEEDRVHRDVVGAHSIDRGLQVGEAAGVGLAVGHQDDR